MATLIHGLIQGRWGHVTGSRQVKIVQSVVMEEGTEHFLKVNEQIYFS